MPRVFLDPFKKRISRMVSFIRGEMKEQDISQQDMSEVIGLKSQQGFSYRIHAGLSVEDLMRILDKLDIDWYELGEILGYEKKNRT